MLPGIRSLFFFFLHTTGSSVCSISFSFFSSETHADLSCLSSFSLLGFDLTATGPPVVRPSAVFAADETQSAKGVTVCGGFGAIACTLETGCDKDATGWLRTAALVDTANWVPRVPWVVVTGRVLVAECERGSAWLAVFVLLCSTPWGFVTFFPACDGCLFSTDEFSILPLLICTEVPLVMGAEDTRGWTLSANCDLTNKTVLLLLFAGFSTFLSLASTEEICFCIGVVREHSTTFTFTCSWLSCAFCRTSPLTELEEISGGGGFGFGKGTYWPASLGDTCTLEFTRGGGPLLCAAFAAWGGTFILSSTPSDMSELALSSSSDILHLLAAGELTTWFWMSATNRFFLRTLFCVALSLFFFLGLPLRTGAVNGKNEK